jgi:hypothetical protein
MSAAWMQRGNVQHECNNSRRIYASEGNHTPAPQTTHRNNGRRMYAGEGNHTPAPQTTHRNNGRRMYAGEGNHTPAPQTTHWNNGRRMYAGEGNHTPAPQTTHMSTAASTRAEHHHLNGPFLRADASPPLLRPSTAAPGP